MAKPNYQHEKRQKDLARKKKQDEKRLRKANKDAQPKEDPSPAPGGESPAPPSPVRGAPEGKRQQTVSPNRM